MTFMLMLWIFATAGMPVFGKHGHLCGRGNHNGSTGELLPHDGKIPPGHECNWHIYPESYNIPEVYMIIEDFHLDKSDSFTISVHDGDKLFGPFSGTKDAFSILTGFLYLDVSVKVESTPSNNRSFKSYFTTNECYYLIEEESGAMTSPLYHDVKSRRNITCTWRFKKFKQVTLPRTVVFNTFHLTKSTLTVKGSKSQDGIYTGTKFPPNITAFGETQFILELDTTVPGETISFKYGLNGLSIPSPDDQLVENNGEQNSTPSSLLRSAHACGHVNFKAANGWFAPKNSTMMAHHTCIWTIEGVESPGIYIVINEYDVMDEDQFFVQKSSDQSKVFGPYFGNKAPFSFFTDETTVDAVLQTGSSDLLKKRHFKAFYSTSGCNFPITNDFGVMHSPVYKVDDQKKTACSWTFTLHEDESVIIVSFDNYNVKSSTLLVDGSINQNQIYKGSDGPFDILMKANGKLTLEIDRTTENETLSFSYNIVSPECSDYIKIMENKNTILSFPSSVSDENSVYCQWIIEGNKNRVLAVYFEDISLHDAKDLLLIKEGKTRKSPNLVQVTEDNQQNVKGSYIVASTPIIWISYSTHSAFKGSHFKISVNVSQERNYFSKGQDFTIIPTESGVDVIFYLEVENEEQVLLNLLPDQELPSSGVILIYDGFSVNTVLGKIQNDKVFYPVVSTGSKMMIVAKDFTKDNSVKLRFDGIKKGCHQVTLNQRDTYFLSGNCNNTCSWTILPQSGDNEGILSLRTESVALRPNDVIEVRQLDNSLTLIETIKSNKNIQPNIYLPASYGAYIKVIRGSCLSADAESTAFFASVGTIRGCSMSIDMIPGEKVSLTSPNYPDAYPLNSNCYWNVSSKAKNLHISFQSFQLAIGHCLKVYEKDESGRVVDTITYDSSVIPGDKMFGNSIAFQLVASLCTVVNHSSPANGNGFVVDVFAIDCGGTVGKEMKGTFNTPDYPKPVKGSLLCIWHVEVPHHNKDGSVNVVLFNMSWSSSSTDDEMGLTIYDGPSLSSEMLINSSTTGLMSRTNSLIFRYEQNGTSDHAALKVDFESRAGNMLCDNGIYMHPDWICNGADECGDYSDEKNCKGRPPPPPPVPPLPPNVNVTRPGVSPAVFWSVAPIMFVLGIASTIMTAYFIKLRRRREVNYDTLPILS